MKPLIIVKCRGVSVPKHNRPLDLDVIHLISWLFLDRPGAFSPAG